MTFTPIDGYRRAIVKTTRRTGSIPRKQAPAKYLFHVTVGRRLYDYPWPPQFTVAWGSGLSLNSYSRWDLNNYYLPEPGEERWWQADPQEVLRLQHCDVTKTGYALKGPGPPPRAQCETNHMGHVIQCEYVMPAVNDPTTVKDWEYQIIAREAANQIQGFRDAMGDQTLIDTTRIRDWHGSAAYGFNDPYEMTCAEWEAYDGLLGHVDVPGQDHWDPGNWDHDYLSALITGYLEEKMATRLGGRTRYDTAVLAARAAFVSASAVYVANGFANADIAVAASLSAARRDGPVLFVSRDTVPAATRNEIIRLGVTDPSKVFIIGGSDIVSDGVAAELDLIVTGG